MRDRYILIAVVLVCVTNVAALGKAAWNRSAATSSMTLTERELMLGHSGDTSLTQLRISWLQHWPIRIDADQGSRMGFNTAMEPAAPDSGDYYRKQLPRLAYLVLEYDGTAWEAYRNRVLRPEPPYIAERPAAERRKALAERDKTIQRSTRLLAIAVDGDAERLRASYPELSRYLIVRARVSLHADLVETPARREHALFASVLELMPANVNVPRPFSVTVRGLTGGGTDRYTRAPSAGPRYVVDIRYGRAYEPWIADLRAQPR